MKELDAVIRTQLKSDMDAYKNDHGGSSEGFDGQASIEKATVSFFKGKDIGASIYKSKSGNKKEFEKVN